MRDGHAETPGELGPVSLDDGNADDGRRVSNVHAVAKVRDLWIRRGLPRSAAATLAQAGIWTVGDLRQLRLAELVMMPALTAAGMAAVLRLLAKSRRRAQHRTEGKTPNQHVSVGTPSGVHRAPS